MIRPTEFAVGLATVMLGALTLTSVPVAAQVAAQVTPPPTVPQDASTPWNTSTTPPLPLPVEDDSALSLRIYDNLTPTSPLPYRPDSPKPDDSAYAVDVSAVMTRCADGNLVITALVIGGRVTPLANRCRTAPGRIRTTPAPQCDANRWNCATAPMHDGNRRVP